MASLQPNQQFSEAHDSDDESENILIEDLEYALSSRFTFEGSFACASRMKNAPNPCLNIDGAGLIGLPLSERDAKLIIECSAQAPYGHGTETLVNKDVRDTWEIEPQKISFGNREWELFVQSVVQSVCSALGVQAAQIMPRCELYKLLLYQVGSHFLPHQDTQKADGMFATMIIVLPSAYTGGQVHVSHSTQSKVFDCSEDSIISTSILAWYTDVLHEVKPVTSGYRLALSYNLIHVSATLPKPILPDMDGPVENLRTVLRDWKENAYTTVPEDSFVAYLLNHQYSERELLRGAMSLKGVDAHKISFLRPIADELGYTVCLGNLTYQIFGDADDYGLNRKRKKKRYGSYGSDSDNYSMAEIHDKSMEISCVVDLNGVRLLKNDLKVSNGSLIPENPFEDAEPDEKSYGGYMGNCAGSLSYWYRRTVLVLIRKEDALTIFCSNRADGFDYGLNRLKEFNNACPTQVEREIAYAMIRNLGSGPRKNDYSCADPRQRISQNIKTMIDYAFTWDDPEMWSSIMQRVGAQYLEISGTDAYFEGWNKFSFSKIEQGLAGTILQITQLRKRLDFIDAIRTHAAKVNETISEDWYKQGLIEALSTYQVTSYYSDDVDVLLQVAQTWGLRLLYENVISPMSRKRVSFDFWICLVRSLLEKKATICVAPRADGDGEEVTQPQQDVSSKLATESEFYAVLNYCLKIIVPQWNDIPLACSATRIYPPKDDDEIEITKINRIIQILDVCFLAGRFELCYNLITFVLIPDRTDLLPSRFKSLYSPLIPKFVDFLKRRSISLTFPPFDLFSRELIHLYLQYILGASRSLTEELANRQKIGCGSCDACEDLDRFMVNPNQKETIFRMIEPRRRHLEERLSATCWRSCQWTTIRGKLPYGLQITKKNDYFASMSWEGRRAAALAFLGSFGNDGLLPVLMGHRWGDVLAALQGVRPFGPNFYHHYHHYHHHHLNPMMVSPPPPPPPPPPPAGAVCAVCVAQPPNPSPAQLQRHQLQGHQHQAHQWHAPAHVQQPHRIGPLTLSTQIMNQTSHHRTVENGDAIDKKRKRSGPADSEDEVIDLTKEN